MTYQEALSYLNCLINYEKKDGYDYRASFKLDRMKLLCALLGDPQKNINSIHVAGSKGKGSTCAIIHSILKTAGFRAGLYTSPHLVSFTERIRIGDSLISEGEMSRILEKVKAAVDTMDDKPSFFEACTAIAYIYFNEKKADFAVYEVGLGGRLDATNVIEPLVCAITPISYEHTQILGKTLTEIAGEKAGIIKENGICVSAPQETEALRMIESVCAKKNAKLILAGRDIHFSEHESALSSQVFSVKGMSEDYERLETGLLGSHQVVNAAVAIGAVEALALHGIAISPDAVRKGVASAYWPGRLEVVRKNPFIVLDGAQNRASAAALVKAVKKLFTYKRLVLVLILTRAQIVERALEPSTMEAMIGQGHTDVSVTANVREALSCASSKAGAEDLVLVTGSLFVVGEARDILTGEKECAERT
jgi:dihydrofolate synthase / folylpolyglutamate synthase